MPASHDRHPWVILSRKEGLALYRFLRSNVDEESDLGRALRVLRRQLAYIATGEGEKPDVREAIEREYS